MKRMFKMQKNGKPKILHFEEEKEEEEEYRSWKLVESEQVG